MNDRVTNNLFVPSQQGAGGVGGGAGSTMPESNYLQAQNRQLALAHALAANKDLQVTDEEIVASAQAFLDFLHGIKKP